MKKRILCTVVAAVTTMALFAGCTGTSSSSSAASSDKAASSSEATTDATTEATTEAYTGTVYNAYIGLQTADWSFRDAWNNPSTGIDGSEGLDFSKIHKSTDGVWSDLPGDLTDTEIKGDGTYTVKAENLEFEDTAFETQDYMNLIFVSTDVPYSEAITISDVVLKVNGSNVTLSDVGFKIPDDSDYISINIQNNWDEEIKTIGYYSTPVKSVEVTFTISGITE